MTIDGFYADEELFSDFFGGELFAGQLQNFDFSPGEIGRGGKQTFGLFTEIALNCP